MKRKLILFSAAAGLAATVVLSSYSGGPAANGQGNRTGSAGNATCGGGGCHGALSTNLQTVVIVADPASPTTPVTQYVPGQTYAVTVACTTSVANHPRFGFQCTAVKASSTSTAAGTLAVGSGTNIALRTPAGSPPLIEHTSAIPALLTTPVTAYASTFSWTAPAAGTGAVRFYAILNAVNFNGQADAADIFNTAMTEVAEKSNAVPQLAADVRISTFPNPASSSMRVKLEGMPAGNANLVLMDATGKAVAHQQITANGSSATASFDVSALAKGVYLLDVAVGGAHRTQRVAVQ